MEISADFGGPSLLPGSGSVCLQSEQSAHRPAFWVLVGPEQNYKVHHPFLQSFWDCRWVIKPQDKSHDTESLISEATGVSVCSNCVWDSVAHVWTLSQMLHSFVIHQTRHSGFYAEDYKVSQMEKNSDLRSFFFMQQLFNFPLFPQSVQCMMVGSYLSVSDQKLYTCVVGIMWVQYVGFKYDNKNNKKWQKP